jgi:hypothetical protein
MPPPATASGVRSRSPSAPSRRRAQAQAGGVLSAVGLKARRHVEFEIGGDLDARRWRCAKRVSCAWPASDRSAAAPFPSILFHQHGVELGKRGPQFGLIGQIPQPGDEAIKPWGQENQIPAGPSHPIRVW